MGKWAADPAASVHIGGIGVAAGSRARVDLPIADLAIGVPITMPVHVVNGRHAGPRLFVAAAVHGDEVNGVEIVRRVLRLRALARLRGALIAVPVVNVPAFLNLSRYLPDRRDLNRSFPGSAKGSLAARLAKLFLDEIVANSTYGIDLHTAARHRENYPQIRGDLDCPEVERMARAFAVPLVIDARRRDGSLRSATRERGVPVIVYEAGEALRFDEAAIRAGVKGVSRVMVHLGMLPARPGSAPRKQPLILESTHWVRAPGSGVVRAYQSIGAHVAAGQLLATLSDPIGELNTAIASPADGVVVGRSNLPLVHEGDALFNIGVAGGRAAAHLLDQYDPFDEYESGHTSELAAEIPGIV